MGTFLNRLKFLVDTLADGKHTVFAKNAGIPASTFQGYLNGRFPKQDHLLRIREHYNVNLDWFYSGVGNPFLEKPGAESAPIYNEETGSALIYNEGNERGKWEKTGLGDAVEQLQKIYASGDKTLIRAINANLEAFSRTVDMAGQVKDLAGRMADMEATIKKLQAMIEEFSKREECCITQGRKEEEKDPHHQSG